jgi:Tfp pilus assembly protein PilN
MVEQTPDEPTSLSATIFELLDAAVLAHESGITASPIDPTERDNRDLAEHIQGFQIELAEIQDRIDALDATAADMHRYDELTILTKHYRQLLDATNKDRQHPPQ